MSRQLKTSRSSRQLILLSPPRRNIFIILIYYTFSVALQLTTFSLSARKISHDINAILSYFSCQQSGENSFCSLDMAQNPFWSLFALIVHLLVPAIHLFLAMRLNNVGVLYKPCLKIIKKVKPQQSSVSSSSLPPSTSVT